MRLFNNTELDFGSQATLPNQLHYTGNVSYPLIFMFFTCEDNDAFLCCFDMKHIHTLLSLDPGPQKQSSVEEKGQCFKVSEVTQRGITYGL